MPDVHPHAENITELLNFRVARLTAVADRSGNSFFMRQFNLRLVEWRIIGLIFTHERLEFRRLSQLLLMDKGQLSRLVKGLVERKLITSEAHEADRRTVVLTLTKEGRVLHDKVLGFAKIRNNIAAGAITAEECTELMRLLDKLIRHSETLWDNRAYQEQGKNANG